MKLFTAQIGKRYDLDRSGIPWIDTTVKSGDKRLAPSWDFLMEYKANKDEVIYTEKFYSKMRKSFTDNKDMWLQIANMNTVCLLCYCPSGEFCHRLILVDMFRHICNKYDIEFEYLGEWK